MIFKINERCTGSVISTDKNLHNIDDYEQLRELTLLPERRYKKIPYSHTENYNDYENFDAQEEAIYQNVIFSNGKSFPETRLNQGEASSISHNETLRQCPENKNSRKNPFTIACTAASGKKKQIKNSVTKPRKETVIVQG